MVIRIDYLIYVYMTLCLCMLAYNLFYLGKNKWMQRRTEKQIQNQARRLQRLLLFPEKTAANVDEKIKKDLKNTHHLVVLEGTVDVLEQNPLTVKPLQTWLPTLKPVFAELIDGTMKKSVMERSYFAYLVTRFRLCGQSRNDPIATAMIQLTAQASIYCRENALGALYQCGSIDHIVKAYRVMGRHEIEHSRKLVTDGLLEFHGDREQLAQALWQNWDEFTPHYQVAFIDFIRMVSGNFRETLFPLLSQPELDREVTFAVMRYFRKYPYRPAGTVLRQTVIDWEKQDWEYAAIAAASLESYPEMETHVSGREAGAAGGDQQIHRPLIAPMPQRGFDLRLFVRYHGGLQNLIACLTQQLCSQRASFVPALSPGTAVTDRQHSGFVHDWFLLFQ